MLLLLVRHADAGDRDPSKWLDDTLRPITDKGRKAQAKVVKVLGDLGLVPELVLTSPWLRAAQTAEIFASRVDELLCLASPSDLGAIGLWYKNFDQTTDEEVVQLLEKARDERRATGRS